MRTDYQMLMGQRASTATVHNWFPQPSGDAILEKIRSYWNEHIHDLAIVAHPVGTPGFFKDLEEYRFEKLCYLPRVVDFSGYKGKRVLEVGCGVGIDLVRFAQNGAIVTGVDLAPQSIALAERNFKHYGLSADLRVMNGEALEFDDGEFDMVYAHGVIQYTANAQKMVDELYRVLKPGGEFIGMLYNRRGWLNYMSKVFKVDLEHEDAPVLEKYTIGEFKKMLSQFSKVIVIPERFPVKSRLQKGVKGMLFNTFFVGTFNLIPRFIVRRMGWHIMAFAYK